MSKNIDEINWLHISDFHFKAGEPYDRDVVLNAFMKSLPDLIERGGRPNFIVASGDIAFSGKRDEYENATIFFDKLLAELDLSKQSLIVVPGNHDVDRSAGKGLARSISDPKELDDYFDPSEALPHVQKRQRGFTDWYNNYFKDIYEFSENTTCQNPLLLKIDDSLVAIFQINSAAFSFDDKDNKKLAIGRRCLSEALSKLPEDDNVYKIAVMHHPLEWLNCHEDANIKSDLRSNVDFILSGHLHNTDIEKVSGVHGDAVHLVSGAIYQTRNYPNTAMFCSLCKNTLTVLPIRYEDKPKELWTVDPSLFSKAAEFKGEFTVPRLAPKDIAAFEHSQNSVNDDQLPVTRSDALIKAAKAEYEDTLFVTPSNVIIYAEPRLMDRGQDYYQEDGDTPGQVFIDNIVSSETSYIIESRAEYGSTTLCNRLVYEFALKNKRAYRRDARNLPKYKKKLEAEFPAEAKVEGGDSILILDNFDRETDERLIKEISNTGWFPRVIALTINRGMTPTHKNDLCTLGYDFSQLHLWPISRDDIRSMASSLFESNDDVFMTHVVDKIYTDLLGLCIPLTPSNVIMYLRVLHKEGEFHPLNRVDIIGRYLHDLLRKPSDAYVDSFNSTNKVDVLSAFVFKIYQNRKSHFDDTYWYSFINEYKEDTLTEFDANELLEEFIKARILVRWQGTVFLKYHFFFNYFLGKHIAPRQSLLKSFLDDEEYLRIPGVIDVITSLNPENTLVIEVLNQKIESHIKVVTDNYLKGGFDPLLHAIWPDSKKEEDELWKPVAADIESGQKSIKEIDKIKSSSFSEAQTEDQQVRYAKLTEIEHALLRLGSLLSDTIRNSDNVKGAIKLSALENIFKSFLFSFQVGAINAPLLAKYDYVQCKGVAFIGFNNAVDPDDPSSMEAMFRVVAALSSAISKGAAERLGTHKLATIFAAREKSSKTIGYMDILNFNCILSAKGKNWDNILKGMIERADKNSFYLSSMLSNLMRNVRNEVIQSKDRDSLKSLIALIQAKRQFNKKNPGQKSVNKMLAHLEETSHFEPPTKD